MQTWKKLAHFNNELLAQVDPVEINLSCSEGLPGAEGIDRASSCQAFDELARRCNDALRRMRPLFDRNPADYRSSKPYFRMLALFTFLQRDLGVQYDRALIDRDDFFGDSRNLFLHGILENKRGTCSSLPPFFAAVGRRLGYPLRLATAKSHIFLRWDDPRGERFNIECTSERMNSDPDEYYLRWPIPTTKEEAKKWCFLKSKSPREELSLYLTNRGHCWYDNDKLRPAVEAFSWAAELEPANHLRSSELCHCMEKWRAQLRQVWPQPFPNVTIDFPPRQFREVPLDLERAIVHLNTMDDLLHNEELDRRWWTPLKMHIKPGDLPDQMVVRYKSQTEYTLTFRR